MLKQDLIDEVQKKEYKDICQKMCPPLWKDLYQELCLIVVEMDSGKIDRIRNTNGARFFLVGILCNMVKSTTSPFYKRYRNTFEIKEQTQEEYNEEEDKQIELINSYLAGEYWFDRELMKSYIEVGSVAKTVAKTGVSTRIIRNSIDKVKKKLKEKMQPFKILLITPKEDTGLKYHRQLAPNQRLAITHPEFTFSSVSGGTTPEGYSFEGSINELPDDLLKTFSIVYYLRQITASFKPGVPKEAVNRIHSLGGKVIMDIDDYWDVPNTHYMAAAYKQLNVSAETEECLRVVDAVITTTEYLADLIRPFNDNVIILPNCVSPDASQFKTRDIQSSRVRFGWIGGVYHKDDLAAISENFCRLAKDKTVRDQYQICLGGYNVLRSDAGIKPNTEYQQIERYMSCNYEFRHWDATYTNYLYTYTPTMEHISYDKPYRRLWAKDVFNYGELYNEIDVALVPLIPNKFNKCKSELKIVEAGAMGKAVIVSDTEPYNKWIKDGVNGLLINPNRNNIDWFTAMRKLIKEPQLRNDLAMGLKETIKEHFDMDKHNLKRAELYRSLC